MTALPAPDRDRGLFETLLIVNGEPIELGAHLDRLAASLAAVFELGPPADLAEAARGHARGMELGRMRIDVRLDGTTTLAVEPVDPADFFPRWERAAALRSLPCDGGLGSHKWADRRALGETRGSTVPLLLDGDDRVLEAGRANVFVASEGVLKTPPADGRILPGLARAGAIGAAREAEIEVLETPLTRGDLLAADEVFLTGSVRGVEPVRSLDGASLRRAGKLSRRVGDRLRRRWLAGSTGAAAPALAGVPRPGPPAR
jgi:para-aminobenzoate synthetase/4-amino-4-deoxychorismate lyase